MSSSPISTRSWPMATLPAGATLDQLLAMDVEKIIPGHGPLSTKQDLVGDEGLPGHIRCRCRELAAKVAMPTPSPPN